MMDAIMIGNLEIFKTLLPLSIFKPQILLHLAIRYGQIEVFKHLCSLFEDWKNLKDKKGRSIQQILEEKNYLFEVNNMEPGEISRTPKFADKKASDVFRREMLEFINWKK